MAEYRFGTRYTRWDGTQQINTLTAEEIMRRDLRRADPRRRSDARAAPALPRGIRDGRTANACPVGGRCSKRVRQQRQEQLKRYDLGSIFEDIKQQLAGHRRNRAPGHRRAAVGARGRQQARSGEVRIRRAKNGRRPGCRDARADGRQEARQLDALPADPAGAIKGLQEYDFMSPQARAEVPGSARHAAAAGHAPDVPGDAAGARAR